MTNNRAKLRWSKEREEIFLDELRQSGNVSAATSKASLTRSLVYKRRKANASFRKNWEEAMDVALDYLEAFLWDKAMGKKNETNDKVVDEKIAIFLLKAHRPEIFGDGKSRTKNMDQKKIISPRKILMKKLDEMSLPKGDEDKHSSEE